MSSTIAVALSGGVDSLVSAHLLKEAGNDIIGLHFVTGYESGADSMASIGHQLDIPLHVIDLRRPFNRKIVAYFIRTYLGGQTPNPCLICNPLIKFGLLFEHARRLGARKLATGHYARVVRRESSDYRLFKGLDRRKDQSYFLAFLTRRHLERAVFPLGEKKKSDVKALAIEKGLQPLHRNESQDVCFIKGTAYGEFVVKEAGIQPLPGDIVDRSGRKLGRHKGLHHYTVGQRRGINCPAPHAYYVLHIDPEQNRLIVGAREETLSPRCRVEKINWIRPAPKAPLRVQTRIRYRHRAAPSTLYPRCPESADIRFDQPQSAITPGQGAVFYDDDEVLGGGLISNWNESMA